MQQNKLKYKAILGLGNPGLKYLKTRHNIGHLFINFLSDKNGFSLVKNRFVLFQRIVFNGQEIIIAKSNVFMNESSISFNYLKDKFKFKTNDILVIHDDSDLFFSNLKLSFAKNSAGHKGVESIISTIKTNKFWRLRFGIRPNNLAGKKHIKADRFVLKNFADLELKELNNIFEKGLKKIKI